jgi:hypothetical protein
MKTSYTPSFKAQVVQELLKETKAISQLAAEHKDTSPQQNRPPEDEAACGPARPHPLARLKTELVWEGKSLSE